MATAQTVEAGTANTVLALDAARADRLWEKRTIAYEGAVTYLLQEQTTLRERLRPQRLDAASSKQREELFARYGPRSHFDWPDRLVTYGSDPVMNAYQAWRSGEVEIVARYQEWEAVRTPGVDTPESEAARQAFNAAVDKNGPRISEVIDVIRGELSARPVEPKARQLQPDGSG